MAAAVNPEDVRVRHVRVTNNTDEVWSDRYDGVPLTLAPGQSETIPLDMALHFFGYTPGADQGSMLLHIAYRTAKTDGDWAGIRADLSKRKKLAEKFFEKFKIEPVTFKLVRDDAPPANRSAPIPADPEDTGAMREPGAVKSGIKEPDEEASPAHPGRGHPRQDTHGRRRE